jgi:hypothetical protein
VNMLLSLSVVMDEGGATIMNSEESFDSLSDELSMTALKKSLFDLLRSIFR